MKKISIFNDVLGPVMHGPSSSHTAASWRIATTARHLFKDQPTDIKITFSADGSYSQVFRQQGVDRAMAAGFLGWPMVDERFEQALDQAKAEGLHLFFGSRPIPEADHPNCVELIFLPEKGEKLIILAKSTGGGSFVIQRLNGWELTFEGYSHLLALETEKRAEPVVQHMVAAWGGADSVTTSHSPHRGFLAIRSHSAPPETLIAQLRSVSGFRQMWTAPPVFDSVPGSTLAGSADEILREAGRRKISLGELGRIYESELLCRSEASVLKEMQHRYKVMEDSVKRGLSRKPLPMQLLEPSAAGLMAAEANGKLALGGSSTRAAIRALATMHVNSSRGVVCAAPTGGSAGVLPGVMVTFAKDRKLSEQTVANALFAAGMVGMVIAHRATFAAEIAGCQVEIGAAGAMAAAAVVDAVGGSAQQALDAAAIALQNSMGSVCDLVQGIVEIPCHTRNAAAAAGAFVCADLVLGGYTNPIPLDETVDAVYAVGRMLPAELRCTARGGLAVTPSALRLGKK